MDQESYIHLLNRYVLQRAHWMSPSTFFLKGAEKYLSVKVPNDDPSKPALRVNIPDDVPHADNRPKLIHNATISNKAFAEPRSRSLISRPKGASLGANFKEGVMSKSESETQVPQLASENILRENDQPKQSSDNSSDGYLASQSSSEMSSCKTCDYAVKAEDKYCEGLQTPLHDRATEEALANSYINNAVLSSKSYEPSTPAKVDTKHSDSSAQIKSEVSPNPKNLFIIVDSQETTKKSATTPVKEEKKNFPPLAEDDFTTMKIPPHKVPPARLQKPKLSWPKFDKGSFKKSRSLPKMTPVKNEAKQTVRKLEVHEVEDVPTFVVHSKQTMNNRSKLYGLGCVPEKEFTTRSETVNHNEAPIKVPGGAAGKSFKGLTNEVAPVEVLPEFVKISESKKKQKLRKSGNWGMKSKVLSMNKNIYYTPSPLPSEPKVEEAAAPVESVEVSTEPESGSPPEYLHTPVDGAAEKGKSFNAFVKDDFGTIRSVIKSHAFKIPSSVPDPAQDESGQTEVEVIPENSVSTEYHSDAAGSFSSRAAEEGSEYNLTKEPEEVNTNAPQNEYSSLWKGNSDWVNPRAVPKLEAPTTSPSEKKIRRANKKTGKHADSEHSPEEEVDTSSNPANSEKTERKVSDFKTSANFVSIACDKAPSYAMKFSAAFPPLLCEALKIRGRILGFRREFLFSDKWTSRFDFAPKHVDVTSKTSKNKVDDMSENSILFPKPETDNVDCSSLFGSKEDMILNLAKTTEKDKTPRLGDNIANVVNDSLTETKGQTCVDSLAMMKKVKKIVELDLSNAIKIFDKEKPPQEVVSVMMLENNRWKVDTETLKKCMKMRKSESANTGVTDFQDVFGDMKSNAKIEDFPKHTPKQLPSKRGVEHKMKLSYHTDSVIAFNPQNNEYFVDKEALANAIHQITDESFDEVIIQALEGQLTKGDGNKSIIMFNAKNGYKLKNGDSILVFDEETQTWKVDFSILQKREQQLQVEEELTRRSELILETFEQLEKNQMTTIPKPDTKKKKTFDYAKKNWKDYTPEKNKDKQTKTKFPFKEFDAEEIRRNNSDMYDNLFVGGSKKETTMNNNSSQSSGVDSPGSSKETKSCSSGGRKALSKGGSEAGSGSPKNPNLSESESKLPPAEQGEEKPCKDEDNFWESFLNMNILPRDIRELPTSKIPPSPSSPPPLPPQPGSRSPLFPPFRTPKSEDPKLKVPVDKIEDPKLKVPVDKIEDPKPTVIQKKIDEPRFKLYLPFIGERKTGDVKDKILEKEPPKTEDRKKKPPEPPASADGAAQPEGQIKTPAKSTPSVEKPTKKPPEPPSAASGTLKDKNIKDSPKGTPKIDEPKQPPSQLPSAVDIKKPEGKIKAPSIPSYPKEDPRSGSSSPTIGAPKSFSKLEHPKVKSPSSSPHLQVHPKLSGGGRKDKFASDHYISENIVEISRNPVKDSSSKFKTNKIETVKLNISMEKRMPSKVTEINLNKKCEEKGKESGVALKKHNPQDPKKPSDFGSKVTEKCTVENKFFYKNFEKYKTPFSDPEYEEKSMKIKSDIESNPNLKKLDNWSKTLVLHDIGKPPENIESWLKDETDKMATLLLKVLQEAADGKPRKKQPLTKSKSIEKTPGNSASKKHESTPEGFLFRVRTVNLSLEDDKSLKAAEDKKSNQKSALIKGSAADLVDKSGKSYKETEQVSSLGKQKPQAAKTITEKRVRSPEETRPEIQKSKLPPAALESLEPTAVSRELTYQNTSHFDITEEVPGPEFLKKLSNTWKVFPIIGSQITIFTLLRLFQLVNLGNSLLSNSSTEKTRTDAFTKLFAKYGPIVNVQGPLSGNVILIHKPEHFNSIFEQDSFAPVRSVFDSLEQTRREAEDKILTTGISTDWSKPEWNDLKKGSCDSLTKGCEKFYESAEAAGDSLIRTIRKNRNMQNCVSEDFMEEIKRWSLEGLCSVMFEKSFGFLERKNSNMSWIMEPDKLYMAVEEATTYLNKCEKGFQTWRVMSTPSSIGLGQAYRSLSTIISKQLYQTEMNLKNKNELIKESGSLISEDLTFLESMLLNDGLTTEEITCNLVDILLIGTNIMNSALGFLLYNLAQNLKVQNKLVKELQRVLPNKNSRMDYENLHSLKYLQACLKESVRLHMPVPIFYRMLQNDILLSNYIIPKGTYVVMDYGVTCMKEQLFDDPEKFIPERWMNEEKWMKDIHPFDTLPLCHGPRAEIAKRIVEMQLWACAAKIVRNFEIEYHYGDIGGAKNLISLPEKPLKLNFTERDS